MWGRGISVLIVAILVGIVGGRLLILIETIGHLDGGTAILLVVAHLQDALILHRVSRSVQGIQLIEIAYLGAQLFGSKTATWR